MKLLKKIKTLLGFAKKNPDATKSALLALLNKIVAIASALKALVAATKDAKADAEEIHQKADAIIAAAEQAAAEVGADAAAAQ